MPSFFSILSFATLGLAITVNKPGKHDLWDSGKPNTISWSYVNTDPSNFDIYLSHMAAHPPLNSLLFSNVPKEQASAVVSNLQLPSGQAYQINLVAHDKPEQIYAQSQQFNVTGEAADATSTLDGYTGPTNTPGASGSGQTTLSTATSSGTASSTGTMSSAATASGESSSATNSSNSSQTASGGSQTQSSTASSAGSSQTPNAAVGNAASAPLAVLFFGAAAFFL